MLQDMGHTSIVWRVRLEANGEDIVAIIPRNMQIIRTSLIMLKV